MADPLLPVDTITEAMIADVARDALRQGGSERPVRDFLLRVDWSRASRASGTPVATMLANLDAWTRQLAEQRLTRSRFITRLLSTLPAPEAAAFRGTGTLPLAARRTASTVRPRQRQ